MGDFKVPKLIILGSSNAIPDEKHENTHMAISCRESTLLIDCVNNPIVRLRQAKLDFNRLTDVILTHFHPDHVSGVPSLLMNMWLMGRKDPINIYGLSYTLDRIEKLMEFYDWASWPRFYPVKFHRIPEKEFAPVFETEELKVFATPVHHLVPTIGLRIDLPEIKHTFAYSCDTEPCSEVVRLAEGADLLIHEASGATLGHSSASQAGSIARQAEVGRLLLIHYPTGGFDARSLVKEAADAYGGNVGLAEDFMEVEL